eukprot:6185235-Pleurochrysis_carterae.AAC.3
MAFEISISNSQSRRTLSSKARTVEVVVRHPGEQGSALWRARLVLSKLSHVTPVSKAQGGGRASDPLFAMN